MRKTTLILFICLTVINLSYSQVEKGDSEITFLGYISTHAGTDISSSFGSILFSYGYFITANFQIGVGPQLSLSSFGGETTTHLSGSVFLNYNFSTSSKMIPYLSAQWYQIDLSPEDGDFLDFAYLNVGIGMRNLFNEYLAFNFQATYGFSLSEFTKRGLMTIKAGLSFIF